MTIIVYSMAIKDYPEAPDRTPEPAGAASGHPASGARGPSARRAEYHQPSGIASTSVQVSVAGVRLESSAQIPTSRS
ncbi:MAG TPA: hypothetical protein VNW71_02410 [Thermoanaerobaculia bacterium]|nr:hypothetical protein [Thermoanaerobaculia bacterium]